MKRTITAFVLLAGLAAVPAAYGQDKPHMGMDKDAPTQAGMMQMHEGGSMMQQEGMKGMMGSSPKMILSQKEALGLDESQIERLEDLQAQMADTHRAQMESMKKLHAETRGVLTDEQLAQVESGMKGMMDGEGCSKMGGMKEDAPAPDDGA